MASRSGKPKRRRKLTKKQLNARLLREHRQYYDALFELQDGRCAICKRTPEQAYAKSIARGKKAPRFNLDHDWVTMKVLGLLCSYCNKKKPDYVDEVWVTNLHKYVIDPPFARLVSGDNKHATQ